MNLLDDIDTPKQPSRASLVKKATSLIGRRKSTRGKKKKKVKTAKWKREYAEALKQQTELKKEFARKIEQM